MEPTPAVHASCALSAERLSVKIAGVFLGQCIVVNFKYGCMELAQFYCPELTDIATFRKMKKWILRCPGL